MTINIFIFTNTSLRVILFFLLRRIILHLQERRIILSQTRTCHYTRRCIMTTNISLIHKNVFAVIQDNV